MEEQQRKRQPVRDYSQQVRTQQIALRVTPAQHEYLKSAAKAADMGESHSKYIQHLIDVDMFGQTSGEPNVARCGGWEVVLATDDAGNLAIEISRDGFFAGQVVRLGEFQSPTKAITLGVPAAAISTEPARRVGKPSKSGRTALDLLEAEG